MADAGDIDRILATTRCVVLGTVDAEGRPWVTPVFFAPLGSDRMYWVSSPDSRHSRNIAARPAVALTVFDSTVAVGRAEAAYFDATAERAHPEEREAALAALDERLPAGKGLTVDDLDPLGPMVLYRADLQHRYVLVRGGDSEYGNTLDMTLEV